MSAYIPCTKPKGPILPFLNFLHFLMVPRGRLKYTIVAREGGAVGLHAHQFTTFSKILKITKFVKTETGYDLVCHQYHGYSVLHSPFTTTFYPQTPVSPAISPFQIFSKQNVPQKCLPKKTKPPFLT